VRDNSTPIWTLLMFESFLRKMLAGDSDAPRMHKAA
jgi:hypothetical protein